MLIHTIRAATAAVIGLTTLSLGAPAFADYVFQTATPGVGGSGAYPITSDSTTGTGDGTDANSNFIGTTFTLTSSTSSLQVGGNFDANGVGSIFAEVVPVASLASLPAVSGTGPNPVIAYLQSSSLGQATIAAPTTAGDASAVINFSTALAPGSYAVILGSGLYGTNNAYSVFGSPAFGSLNLTDGNTTVGSPNVFSSDYGDSFQAYGYDTGMRIFAETPVPLPAAVWLMLSSLGGAFAFVRRRKVA